MSLIEIILILAFVLASIWFIFKQKVIFKYFYEKITGKKLKDIKEKDNTNSQKNTLMKGEIYNE